MGFAVLSFSTQYMSAGPRTLAALLFTLALYRLKGGCNRVEHGPFTMPIATEALRTPIPAPTGIEPGAANTESMGVKYTPGCGVPSI
jgi:hypothetical protein